MIMQVDIYHTQAEPVAVIMGANTDTGAINMQTASVEIVGLRWGE